MRRFTGNKDTDKIILSKLDDKDLLSILSTNKYLSTLPDDSFWRNRLYRKYPNYEKEENWKETYLTTVYYIDKLKRDFNFIYTSGDPKYVYDFLDRLRKIKATGYGPDVYKELLKKGYEDLVVYLTNRLRRMAGSEEYKLGTEEWEAHKLRYFTT